MDKEKLFDKLFKMREEVDNEHRMKVFIIGQIAAMLALEKTVWRIEGGKGMTIEMLTDILSKLEISHGKITCQDYTFFIPINT